LVKNNGIRLKTRNALQRGTLKSGAKRRRTQNGRRWWRRKALHKVWVIIVI
jgi:hypothetical protein